MTKKHLFGAVAALTIAAPGAALAQSGYIDFGYASSETEFLGFEDEADGWTLGGAVALGSDGLGFQFDGLLSKGESDGGDDVDSYNFGGHMFVRDPSSYLFGGFVNLGNVEAG